MVRLATALCHIPKIKFRKGGVGGPSAPAQAAPAAAASSAPTAAAAAPQAQATAATGAIPDLELPYRYQRHLPTDEEIAIINGGGIV